MKKQLGPYEIIEQIAPGGSTIVYRANEDMGLGMKRPAAVKLLQGWRTDDAEEMVALRREVEILIELGSTTNIVNVRHFAIDPEVGPWIGMELLQQSLRHDITADPADPNLVTAVIADVLSGLRQMHALSPPVIHRDIKPANIVRDNAGTYKITDFGLAQRFDEGSTLTRVSVRYAAPEILDDQLGPVGPWTDLYSLGITAYELALGQKLFRAQFPSIYDPQSPEPDKAVDDRPKWMYWHCSLQQNVKPLAEIIPDFPKELSDLIAAMMVKPTAARLQSVEEAERRLSGISAVRRVYGTQMQTGGPAKKGLIASMPPRTRALALATIAIVGIVGIALFTLYQEASRPVILLARDTPFTSRAETVRVTGRIENLPSRARGTITVRDLGDFPVTFDSTGAFTTDVRLPRLGETSAQLKLLSSGGDELASRIINLERQPPESVQIRVQTRPSIAGARVRWNSLASRAEPIEAFTSADGAAAATMPYGRFELAVQHPRFRPLQGSFDTEFEPQRSLTASLVELPADVIDRRRTQLLNELDTLAERAAAGDPDAIARIKEIQTELAATGDTTLNAARRAAIIDDIARVAEAAARGDPAAVARLRQLRQELASLDDQGAIEQRRGEIMAQMKELAERAAAGDPIAAARMRELAGELDKLDEAERAGAGGPVAQRLARERQRLVKEMADLAERAAAGDPAAIARLRTAQTRLDALRDEALGVAYDRPATRRDDAPPADDPAYFTGSTSELMQVLPSLGIIDRAVLLRMPQSQFRAYLERHAPLDTIVFSDIPELKKVRASGPVFSEAEAGRLASRLAPAIDRLEIEVVVDAASVCRRVHSALETAGGRRVRVHAAPVQNRLVMFVRFDESPELGRERAATIVARYVLDHSLIDLVCFAPAPPG